MTDYLNQLAQVLQTLPRQTLQAIAERLWEAYTYDRQVFTCGNGGSASAASHFVTDLGKGIDVPAGARRFRALSLCDNLFTLTAYANDMGYENVFCEPLRNLVRAGDVLLAVSGSGNSENVLRAMATARKSGATTIGLTGRDGGRMKGEADICLIAPTESMKQIEDVHIAVLHALYLELKARGEAVG
jgi:D-sedoheptulose 7-phosphate isomerase